MAAVATPLDIEVRTKTGKGASRALRREGRVPAVLYGGKEEPVHFSLNPLQLDRELHKTGFLSTIFEVSVNNKKEKMLPREVHFHPVTDRPLHVDFMRISKGKKITISIPVQFINEDKAPGIKQGGILNILVHNLDVIADIDHIPAAFEIDLTGAEIHHSIHLAELNLPETALPAHPERDNIIATIVPPTIAKQTEEEEAATEGEEGPGGSEASESSEPEEEAKE